MQQVRALRFVLPAPAPQAVPAAGLSLQVRRAEPLAGEGCRAPPTLSLYFRSRNQCSFSSSSACIQVITSGTKQRFYFKVRIVVSKTGLREKTVPGEQLCLPIQVCALPNEFPPAFGWLQPGCPFLLQLLGAVLWGSGAAQALTAIPFLCWF